MDPAPSLTMRAATAVFEVFVVAVVAAFVITVAAGTLEMQVLATGLVAPMIAISLFLVRYCRRGRAWSFAGASVLGAFGVALRLIVSTHPSLEVGGDLPSSVTALYAALGALVVLLNLESVLELRRSSPRP
ncbi:MAG TPA: hypothetical protein VLX56_00840 [Nitrososphaerales archaeon]|nr:hypothetical protein [Nitrososphaerales archaeon]